MAEPGRPPFKPTEEHREQVKLMTSLGIPQDRICRVIGISVPTLEKHFRDEIDLGAVEAHVKVGKFLFDKAQTDLPAAFFYAKTRMGWREKDREEDGDDAISVVITGGLPPRGT